MISLNRKKAIGFLATVVLAASAVGCPLDRDGLGKGQHVFQSITVADDHVCAITKDGAAACWGSGMWGALGNGSAESKEEPTLVSGLNSGVRAISTSGGHTCAITSTGAVMCFGTYGIGDGTIETRLVPTLVVGLESGAKAVSVGPEHSCAINKDRDVMCWGINRFGQVSGQVTTLVPVKVPGVESVVAIAAGYHHTCALTEQGAVKCWGLWPSLGKNPEGGVADTIWYGGVMIKRSIVPLDVPGLASGVIAISAGGPRTCALTSVGTVKCWGERDLPSKDTVSLAGNYEPRQVDGLESGVTAISTGIDFSCALMKDGSVMCWADDISREAGVDASPPARFGGKPTVAAGVESELREIAVGGNLVCGLSTNGAFRCW